LRPLLVAIRARKPWTRFRRLLCGWYVRFIGTSHVSRSCRPGTDLLARKKGRRS
jgi:hypothetical protein